MKINNNRGCDTMQAEYFNQQSVSDGANMSYAASMGSMGMDCCAAMPNVMPQMMNETMPGVVCPPVYECPRETVVNRYICHEVPHIMPCNTRIINHHIYRHTYTPTYSCCEENEVQNVYERRCC